MLVLPIRAASRATPRPWKRLLFSPIAVSEGLDGTLYQSDAAGVGAMALGQTTSPWWCLRRQSSFSKTMSGGLLLRSAPVTVVLILYRRDPSTRGPF